MWRTKEGWENTQYNLPSVLGLNEKWCIVLDARFLIIPMSKYFVLRKISVFIGSNILHFILASISFLEWHSKYLTVDSGYPHSQPYVPFGSYTHNTLLFTIAIPGTSIALYTLHCSLCLDFFPSNKLYSFFKNQLKKWFHVLSSLS